MAKTTDAQPERLVWCGPPGHFSHIHGDLIPGHRYEIAADAVESCLAQSDYWTRAAATPAPTEEPDK